MQYHRGPKGPLLIQGQTLTQTQRQKWVIADNPLNTEACLLMFSITVYFQ